MNWWARFLMKRRVAMNCKKDYKTSLTSNFAANDAFREALQASEEAAYKVIHGHEEGAK